MIRCFIPTWNMKIPIFDFQIFFRLQLDLIEWGIFPLIPKGPHAKYRKFALEFFVNKVGFWEDNLGYIALPRYPLNMGQPLRACTKFLNAKSIAGRKVPWRMRINCSFVMCLLDF